MALVDVIIVNWNGLHFLSECLGALSRQTFSEFEVWLVDNGSRDGSVDWVRYHYPDVHLVVNDRNLGFAAANNQAIRLGRAPFVATLNNDAVPEPQWLAEMVSVAQSHPEVGIVASLMLFHHAPDVINSAGIAVDRLGFAWDRLGGQPIHASEQVPTPVFGASAGAALYRRTMLDEIGLFDEDFFAYLEDVDLAWRAQWAGWECLYVPTARVLHHHSGTAGEGSPLKDYLLARNKVWLVAKNYPFGAMKAYLPLLLAYDLLAMISVSLRHGRLDAVRGRVAGWRAWSKMLSKRQQVIQRACEQQITYRLLPAESPLRVAARYKHLSTSMGVTWAGKSPARLCR